MIEDATKIEGDLPVEPGAFQAEILDHWREIQHGRRYPDKREFRPQKFPRFLPQLAIVSVNGEDDYDDRLTGATVLEVLRLSKSHDRLVDPADGNVRELVRNMLSSTAKADAPMYFKGQFQPEETRPIDFTALVLPFSHNGDADVLDTMMLAFDFSKRQSIEVSFDEEISTTY